MARQSNAKRWVFTLNNYTDAEQGVIDGAFAAGGIDYLVSGREVADSGTPHLQGFVIFGQRRGFNSVKATLGARLHLEVARGTNKQAADYCKKDGDFVEYGTLPEGQGKRTDWDRYREWVEGLGRVPTRREIACEFTSLYARYAERCVEIAEAYLPPPQLLPGVPALRDWQANLHDVLKEDCDDDRTIMFYVDAQGNSGKSWMCRFMLQTYPLRVQVLGVGKVTDIAYMIESEKDIFMFDCERSASEFLQYRVLEQLKNQMVTSTKYSGQMKILRKIPHVVVFMNEYPQMQALTNDRYEVNEI